MRRFFRLTLAVMSAALLATGCGGDDPSKPNLPPTVTFTQFPVPGSTVTDDLALAWSGSDPDGVVAGYEYSLDSETEFTATGDSTTVLQFTKLDGSDSNPRPHVFRVRAVDDRGLEGETAAVSFVVAIFNDPPTVAFTRTPSSEGYIGPVAELAWEGADSDGSIDRFEYALGDTALGWTATADTSLTIDFSSGGPVIGSPGRGWRGPLNTPVDYTFSLRAIDDEGKSSVVVTTRFLAGPENVAPEVTLLSGPPAPPGVVTGSATWTWNAEDPDGALLRVQYSVTQGAPGSWTRWDGTSLTLQFTRADGTAENPVPYTFHLRAQDDDSTYSAVVSRDFLVGVPNQPPTVSFTTFPDPETPVLYRFTYAWQGRDDEGVAYYEYAVDDTADGGGASLWKQTTATSLLVVFPAATVDQGSCGPSGCNSSGEHTFHLRAVDAAGLRSAAISSRAKTFNRTPFSVFTQPTPVAAGVQLTPGSEVRWNTTDVVGSPGQVLRYEVLTREVADFADHPDAGDAVTEAGLAWDAVSGTERKFTPLLESGRKYLVAVRAIDEAQAVESYFAYDRNVLKVTVP